MSLELSKNVNSICPSATMAMVEKIEEVKKTGKSVISLNIGEPDFATPKHINEAIINAINDGKTKYVSAAGIKELRSAIVDKLAKDNQLHYNINQIVVTTGAKQALFESIMALVNEGDEIIIPTPCWVSYEEMVKAAGGKCVFVPTKKDTFQLDVDKIKNAITDKTKAIIINTPNNPTGCVYSKESLLELADLACEKEFYVISDEIYEKLIYDDSIHYSIASFNDKIYQQTITINGFAKAYAMTGLRLGYLAANEEIAKKISNLQTHLTSNATTPVQYGGIAALESKQDLLKEMVLEFEKRRELALECLEKIPNIKYNCAKGAFYIMIDVSYYINKSKEIETCEQLAIYLLEHAQVALVSGESFQACDYLRLSYSNSQENIREGLMKLKEVLENIK